MRTLWTYLFTISYALYSIFPLQKVKKAIKNNLVEQEEYKDLPYAFPRKWARKSMEQTGSTINVMGNEKFPDGPVLVVANHQGNFDIFAVLGFLDKPLGFISKMEVKKVPLARTWMEYMHCVFLDRKDKRQSVKAFRDGIQYLQDGYSLVIFPEGTRSKGKHTNPFKSGSFRLATKAGVPIVPVAINGTYKIMEANKNRIKAANVDIHVCDPITPEEYEGLSLDALAELTQSRIVEKIQNN
ncbi:lysophospholipid acyltransferase family protein [Salirhabdus sp. Marseille-P4669]|uniref:lysophospholipid acyltransferase family protein n=1 Tax=Salirhabdus sp. Marseille-P4669 TaxID=2042310 RepID=UPI000C7D89D6|nr:lysophospholipid acyltransferase family protein [Salirhabdus sp. Marseille-P4669]